MIRYWDLSKKIYNIEKSNLELCYRYEYLNMSLDDFYKKGYDVGIKLAEKFEDKLKI